MGSVTSYCENFRGISQSANYWQGPGLLWSSAVPAAWEELKKSDNDVVRLVVVPGYVSADNCDESSELTS